MATCDVTAHRCVPSGVPLPAGTPCSTGTVSIGVCTGGTTSACTPAGCGNGLVEAGEDCDDRRDGDDADGCTDVCRFTCAASIDCDDGDACTGTESCDVATHRCVSGTPLSCIAADACHAARCDAAAGCLITLRDGDGDGHASTALGACGTDCDDARADAYPGAAELCDGVDNNCVGGVDEIAPTWFVDCDRDGYAASLGGAVAACATPATSPGCPAGAAPWTSLRPAGASSTDCNDGNSSIRPGAGEVVGDGVDQNCDGSELCYADGDRDGFRTTATLTSANATCSDPGEAASTAPAGDCNDASLAIRPSATEIVGDEVDQNCDGFELCFVNDDGDSHRVDATVDSANSSCSDGGEARATVPPGDCDDSAAFVHPGAVEPCGASRDYDCNGVVNCCYFDEDHDSYGSTATRANDDLDCTDAGESRNNRDCAPSNPAVCPGRDEQVGDSRDHDCDGREICYRDDDLDGCRSPTGLIISSDTDCYDDGEASLVAPVDCCATDARVRCDGATGAYTSETACGGWDYDCDGTSTPTITARYACTRVSSTTTCRATSGWISTAPACGATGAYLIAGPGGEGCQYLGGTCLPIAGYLSTTFAQRCR